MNFVVKFTESDEIFKSNFGEVNAVSDGGFERGYAQGLEEGEKQGYTKGYADGESKGFEQGYEQGNSLYYAGNIGAIYYNAVFPENYELVLRVKEITRELYQTFYRTQNLKKVKLIVDNKESSIALSQTFRENTSIEVVDLTETSRKITNVDYCFFQCSNLISIFGALDLTEVKSDNYAFFARSLRDIEIVPNTLKVNMRFNSGNLSNASIESIINGLADLTDSTTPTLILNGVGAKLIEEQRERVRAKNWTLAY